MASQQDLCLLQDLKAWIYGDPTANKWPVTADVQLAAYISAASRAVLTCLNRATLVAHNVVERRTNYRNDRIVLKEYPLLGDLTSIAVDGVTFPKQTASLGRGWVNMNPWDGYSPGSPAVIANLLNGGAACGGPSGVVDVSYVAGYAVLSEVATVPSSPPYTIQPLEPLGRFAADVSVIYANLTALIAAASVGGIVHGKYLPPIPPSGPIINDSWVPVYTFDSSDAGASVLLSYSFTPADLRFAVTKWVGEWWSYKTRIGEASKALPSGAGTATYSLKAMPDDITLIINPYKRAFPTY